MRSIHFKSTVGLPVLACLFLNSCSDKEVSQVETKPETQKVFVDEYQKHKELISSAVLQEHGKFLKSTPPHFTMTGPTYDFEETGEQGIIFYTVRWTWDSDVKLYRGAGGTFVGPHKYIVRVPQEELFREFEIIGSMADVNGRLQLLDCQRGKHQNPSYFMRSWPKPKSSFPNLPVQSAL